MPVSNIAFTMYPVSDVPRAVAFYSEVLGLEQVGHAQPFWVEFDIAGTTFGVGNLPHAGKAGSAQSLSLEIADLASFRRKLADAGVETSEPHETPVCFISGVSDPDGNKIWLHESKAASA